jgi:hypothetical protein
LHGRSPGDISGLADRAITRFGFFLSLPTSYPAEIEVIALAHEHKRLKAEHTAAPPPDWLAHAIEESGDSEISNWSELLTFISVMGQRIESAECKTKEAETRVSELEASVEQLRVELNRGKWRAWANGMPDERMSSNMSEVVDPAGGTMRPAANPDAHLAKLDEILVAVKELGNA